MTEPVETAILAGGCYERLRLERRELASEVADVLTRALWVAFHQ
jgi:hypothetical protein